jgi:hypothetical protein
MDTQGTQSGRRDVAGISAVYGKGDSTFTAKGLPDVPVE